MDELKALGPVTRDDIAASIAECRDIASAIEAMLADDGTDLDGIQERLDEIATEVVNLGAWIQEVGIAPAD